MLDRDDLKQRYEKFLELEKVTSHIFLMFPDSVKTFIAGLAALRLFRQTRDQSWLNKGTECKNKMKHWAEEGSAWNFEHKLVLLEAEAYFSCGNFELAKSSYKHAIAKAQSHRFVNDLALSHELTGKFYVEIGDLSTSLEYFMLAHENYDRWGAVAKASLLFGFVNEKFAPLGNISICSQQSGSAAS